MHVLALFAVSFSLRAIYRCSDGQVCCQDLNEEVLQHVTIPNFRMNLGRISRSPAPSLAAPASATSSASVSEHSPSGVDSTDSLPPVHFIAGDWADEALLALLCARGPFDLVLSSDTLYAAESTPHLIGVLKRVLRRPHGISVVAVSFLESVCNYLSSRRLYCSSMVVFR